MPGGAGVWRFPLSPGRARTATMRVSCGFFRTRRNPVVPCRSRVGPFDQVSDALEGIVPGMEPDAPRAGKERE